MTPLSRVNLTADLRERVLERYGSFAKAARALGEPLMRLSRKLSVKRAEHQGDSTVEAVRLLKRLGYSVHYVIVDDLFERNKLTQMRELLLAAQTAEQIGIHLYDMSAIKEIVDAMLRAEKRTD